MFFTSPQCLEFGFSFHLHFSVLHHCYFVPHSPCTSFLSDFLIRLLSFSWNVTVFLGDESVLRPNIFIHLQSV